jgi:hypothetical protein
MLYRRKILLALLETFGDFLTMEDCCNLLLLFCQRRGKNYYDFFSHASGPYSFLLEQDKARLTTLGFLTNQSIFCCTNQDSFFPQILKEDILVLHALLCEIGEIRGEQLMRKIYLECPVMASRSENASSILSHLEYVEVQRAWHKDTTQALFTLGYEGLSIDAYINILLVNNISALVDVRKNPLSMKYGFSKTKLNNYLKQVGIFYFHLSELGIPSVLRKELNSVSAYETLFAYYRSHILPDQNEAIEQLKYIADAQERMVLTCFEANPQCCHRHEITDYLERGESFTLPIIHLNKTCTQQALAG